MWKYEEIEKEVKRLKIPKQFHHIKTDVLLTHDYYMLLSIRADSGKTTDALLYGMVLNFLYGTTIEYLRSDESQIKKSSVESMFDVIKKYDYINTLYRGEYNSVIYKPMVKKFYLVLLDENGEEVKRQEEPLCCCHSLEKYIEMKSVYNNPKGDYILYDEFVDSSRSSFNQMVELQNQISTIIRDRNGRVVMLSNNVNKYSQWWEEFTIEKDINALEFGGAIDKKTELGTTIYCELLDVSEKKKEETRNKKIRFSGFNTPKMNAFNGLASWQGTSHQHLHDEELLRAENLVTNRFYIKHRNRYAQICIYYDDEFGEFAFVHYSNEPKLNDNIVLTLTPQSKYEIFGFGKFCDVEHIRDVCYKVVGMRTQNKWYYATNSVGDLIDDYFKEMAA